MAFTVNDLQDFLKLLREHPEWRAEVRKEVLGDELLALPDLVRQNSLDIQKLIERMDRLTERVDSLTQNVNRLVEEMRGVKVDVAQMKGDLLEVWYRDHPGPIARLHRLKRVHVPDLRELALLDEAVEGGKLTEEEVDALYDLDLIIAGREGHGADARDALLAVEISNQVDTHDVDRSLERAALLRAAGYTAHPVVAGRRIDTRTQRYASDRAVLVHLRRESRDSSEAG